MNHKKNIYSYCRSHKAHFDEKPKLKGELKITEHKVSQETDTKLVLTGTVSVSLFLYIPINRFFENGTLRTAIDCQLCMMKNSPITLTPLV